MAESKLAFVWAWSRSPESMKLYVGLMVSDMMTADISHFGPLLKEAATADHRKDFISPLVRTAFLIRVIF